MNHSKSFHHQLATYAHNPASEKVPYHSVVTQHDASHSGPLVDV